MKLDDVDVDDEFMETHLGVPGGCKIADQRVIQTGRGGSLELFQYSGAEPTPAAVFRCPTRAIVWLEREQFQDQESRKTGVG